MAQLATELASKLGGVEKTLEALAEKQRHHMHSMLWAQFAAAGLSGGDPDAISAKNADWMLEEWIKRWDTPAGDGQ